MRDSKIVRQTLIDLIQQARQMYLPDFDSVSVLPHSDVDNVFSIHYPDGDVYNVAVITKTRKGTDTDDDRRGTARRVEPLPLDRAEEIASRGRPDE